MKGGCYEGSFTVASSRLLQRAPRGVILRGYYEATWKGTVDIQGFSVGSRGILDLRVLLNGSWSEGSGPRFGFAGELLLGLGVAMRV